MKRLQNIFLYTSSLTFYKASRKVVMIEVISPLINMIAVGLRPSSMAKDLRNPKNFTALTVHREERHVFILCKILKRAN